MIRDYDIVDGEHCIIRETKEIKPYHYSIKELFKHNIIEFEIMPNGWGEYMSIKDNIKEELLKMIDEEVQAIRKVYTDNQYIYFTTNDEFAKGKIVSCEDEYIFLQRLKDFVKSI